ncbi:nucleotidyltransferase family protein [Phosphitispora fastidiosa]|uniref:nucleotidyltransferase family protein n=1 Tax=Phosphitispora fastidiosa TaxID=2837202 RepID=UPI001E28E64A|nr:nucleotidyltransferase family protein [Phosphitispora fastidiosa]MBU7008494.1 dTDP-glucose pyrophosphorylase [Phosphitispora fastidiosa]
MWRNVLITPKTPIVKAIDIIDRSGLRIALVVNDNGRLLGTVTDGDIRRAILKQLSLDEAVSVVMNPAPSYVYSEQSRQNAIQLMKSKKLHQIPVLDKGHHVVGLEIADELFAPPSRDNWVMLMAGGLGRRLEPLTENCPKPLLKIGNKPLLETILESFAEQGFRHFYISVNYKAEMIKKHFGDGSHWAVDIKYLQEGKSLGTAGALGLLPAKPEEPLLLMNGDILTKMNYGKLLDFHYKNLAEATICVKEYNNQIPYGVVTVKKDRLLKIEEKPQHHFFISGGIYVFNPAVLDYVPHGSSLDIPDLLRTLLAQEKKIAAFPIREYWIDIGHFDDYQKANNDFAKVFK